MTEQDRADAFSRDLDHLLTGRGTAPESSDELLGFAEWMTSHDLTAGTEAHQRAFKTRLTGENTMEMVLKNRKWAVAAACAVVLIGLLLSPLPSYAANLFRQIGGITLSDGSTAAEQSEADGVVHQDVEGIPTAMPPAQLSVSEAADAAGFNVAVIDVPQGFTQTGREVHPGQGENMNVLTRYNNGSDFLTLSQSKIDTALPAPYGQWDIGDAEVTDVSVGDFEAIYVADAQIIAMPGDEPGSISASGANILIWADADHTFSLMSNTLTMEDLVAIAETLTK